MSAILGRRVIAGLAGRIRATKYNNKPTESQGKTFASKKEARRYDQLLLLEKNGEVRGIKCQQEYRLEVNGHLVCKYRADFTYEELRRHEWHFVVEDVKGFQTAVYRLKKKLMVAVFDIEVRET
jgi:hypothetical protein